MIACSCDCTTSTLFTNFLVFVAFRVQPLCCILIAVTFTVTVASFAYEWSLPRPIPIHNTHNQYSIYERLIIDPIPIIITLKGTIAYSEYGREKQQGKKSEQETSNCIWKTGKRNRGTSWTRHVLDEEKDNGFFFGSCGQDAHVAAAVPVCNILRLQNSSATCVDKVYRGFFELSES